MLKIDAKGLQNALTLALIAECEILTDWLYDQVQGKAPKEVNRSMIKKEVVKVGSLVVGRVSAAGIGALTTEWGSGSLADETNPMWQKYVDSEYWNDARNPYLHPITGRPAGPYVNLDGETQISSGLMEGYNLEQFLKPIKPQHWMQEIVKLSRPIILERLIETIQLFPIHKYIHSDRR